MQPNKALACSSTSRPVINKHHPSTSGEGDGQEGILAAAGGSHGRVRSAKRARPYADPSETSETSELMSRGICWFPCEGQRCFFLFEINGQR